MPCRDTLERTPVAALPSSRDCKVRLSILLLTVLFGAPPAVAQTPQPGWIADSTTGCRVWNSNPEPNETINWSGDCPDGVASGHGVLQWFKDGKVNGHFEGGLLNGRQEGQGVFTWPDRGRYEGGFSKGRKTGHGVYIWVQGDRYEGEWFDDKPNGLGLLRKADGTRYKGTWTNGCYKVSTTRLGLFELSKEMCSN